MGIQGGRIWRGATNAGWFATDQYWLELIRDNLDAPPGLFGGVYQPMWPPSSVVVIGKRQNNIWQFFYQECQTLRFYITRERTTQLNTSSTLLMNLAGTAPANYDATTIMNYGQLWPEPSRFIFRVAG